LYDDDTIAKSVAVFTALSNESRLRILLMVAETDRPLHIKAVATQLKLDYGAIYRHVEILEKANLIKIYDVGRSRVLSLKSADTIQKFVEQARKIKEE
jgi:DNA-binding transcriptional ArsR family regulator